MVCGGAHPDLEARDSSVRACPGDLPREHQEFIGTGRGASQVPRADVSQQAPSRTRRRCLQLSVRGNPIQSCTCSLSSVSGEGNMRRKKNCRKPKLQFLFNLKTL